MKIAILEQIEPENCFQCVISFKRDGQWLCGGCSYRKTVDITAKERPSFCPLKIIESLD